MREFLILMKSEWLVSAIIIFLLIVKIGRGIKNEWLLPIIQTLLLISLAAGFLYNEEGRLFDGMFRTSSLISFQKSILLLGVYLISLLFSDWLKGSAYLAEFFILLLSALLGMFLMISSGNLLIFYLSLELSTIPVAALANFDLELKRSSEGAMKMILSSAFSSGTLLFGISLLYGATGTIRFDEMPYHLNGSTLEVFAFVFLFTAFAFKLSIVPFHLWTADVYEGAPMPATSFLSVISKGSIAFIFINVLYHTFQPLQNTWYDLMMVLAIATMTIGNLFALRQQNIKRFLAFSSIAQVGFIMVGMTSNDLSGIDAVVYFILIYVFSNLAAFGVASLISTQTGMEKISDYKGFYEKNRLLCWIMALALFSLAGVPPTAGFFGKLFLLSAGASRGNFIFITIAALNMIISFYYYLNIVRSMFMEKNENPVEKIKINPSANFALIICTAGILLVGLMSWIYRYITELS